ncbi:hypothetical protein [Ruicaihuangia caeni]|uniref:Uncharacterized protein n=1 Tax=Ruicaihuangia caeni TaxID=3042517 RepID=A0AAW6T7C7_9MICO|nr:hypothetical protein [Klugiella sp. YN-L-19]MDI2099129.1 hypothetical protein [Klugiella sp. YN-L-19]
MRVVVTHEGVAIEDVGDLKRFSIESSVGESLDDQLRAARAGHRTDSDHAAIEIAYIRHAVGDARDDAEWRSAFERMIDYASTKGWVTDDRRTVIGHIEAIGAS